ncbi:hypothetical protein [Anaerosporobacter sp.]|uniref:hypothetical protein n=1 Tax=Anaerosporobacter sp. TaxID=1872529 RepID=UPI00286F4987|nr:hypothetical protein [Anaerosporobacter sp.]
MTLEALRQRMSAIEAQSTLQRTYTENSNQTTGTTENSNRDSYISSLNESSSVLPSETYGNIMELIKAAKQANGEEPNAPTQEDFDNIINQLSSSSTQTSTVEADDEETIATTTGSSSTSGSSESSESETIKEYVVGQNGAIYLKVTTTDSEGNETVTMTKVADKPKHRGMTPPPPMMGMEDTNSEDATSVTEEASTEEV